MARSIMVRGLVFKQGRVKRLRELSRARRKQKCIFFPFDPSLLQSLEDGANDVRFDLGVGRRIQSQGESSLFGDRCGLIDRYVGGTNA